MSLKSFSHTHTMQIANFQCEKAKQITFHFGMRENSPYKYIYIIGDISHIYKIFITRYPK